MIAIVSILRRMSVFYGIAANIRHNVICGRTAPTSALPEGNHHMYGNNKHALIAVIIIAIVLIVGGFLTGTIWNDAYTQGF